MTARNKKISKKRETVMGKQIGGRPHIASGALWFQKGDFSNADIIIEDKFTHKDTFSLNTTILSKIEKEGKKENKIPFVTVGFHTYKFSAAVINAKYLNPEVSTETSLEYITKGKSVLLKYQELYNSYIHGNTTYIGKIQIGEDLFYIIEWETFIEKISSFLFI